MANGLRRGSRSLGRARGLFALAVAALLAPAAHAQKKIKIEQLGYVESDVRFALPGKALEREDGTLRFNENRFGYQIDAKLNEHVAARAAGRVIFVGFSNVPSAFALTQRPNVDPFWWELDAAYLELRDIGVEGLDLRLGRQVIHWGTGDQFNPTNNLNPYDFRDPLLFGQNLANNALKIDYTPGKDVVFTGVWVPVFRTSQLPISGLRILSDQSAFARRFGANAMNDLPSTAGFQLNYQLDNQTPQFDLKNSMVAAKVAFKLLGGDFSLSYFKGAFSLPRPLLVESTATAPMKQDVRIQLGYPSMQVLGFDFTTSISWLKGLGFWVEGAVVFHDTLSTRVVSRDPSLASALPPDGTVFDRTFNETDSKQFLKLTIGVDYSFHRQLYANVQYLHGFVDEFGASQLNDYIVAGFDIKSPSDKWVLRLFGVLNLQDRSHVYYPVLIMKPWAGTEFHAGALLYGGNAGTKFGGLESGSNLFFLKGRISF